MVCGNYDDPIYELMLSEHLNAPIFGSLTVKNGAEEQKRFFLRAGLKTMKYCVIQPKTTMEKLLTAVSELLLGNF
jgi:phosphoribosylaminoimidazole carboxylase (NCAIR synthetase)